MSLKKIGDVVTGEVKMQQGSGNPVFLWWLPDSCAHRAQEISSSLLFRGYLQRQGCLAALVQQNSDLAEDDF